MESESESFSYLKITVIILIILVVGLLVYWVLSFKSTSPKVSNEVVDEVRQIKVANKSGVNKVYDYTSTNVIPAGEVKIYGNFISADHEQMTIDSEMYIYVIGVQNEDGSISKIHLKRDEYELIGGTLPKDRFWVTRPVVVTISAQGIYIDIVN